MDLSTIFVLLLLAHSAMQQTTNEIINGNESSTPETVFTESGNTTETQTGATIAETTFTESDTTTEIYTGTTVPETTFTESDTTTEMYTGTTIPETTFTESDITTEMFTGATIPETTFTESDTTTQMYTAHSAMQQTTNEIINGNGVLYEYGNATDSLTARTDGGAVLVDLTVNFPFGGNTYSSFSVSNYGYLNFSGPLIAPFLAQISTAVSGDIYYRQSTDPSLLANATQDINTYFPGLGFSAQWVFIATWDKVPQNGGTASQVNTFQVVLITDGTISFALFNYADIQWTTNAQAFWYNGTQVYQLNTPGSVFNWTTSSNVNYPGRWAFMVGTVQPVESTTPETVFTESGSTTETQTGATEPETTFTESDTTTEMYTGTIIPETTYTPSYFTTYSQTAQSTIQQTTERQVIYRNALLYPYGPGLDFVTIKSDDGASEAIQLSMNISIFGKSFSSLYIDTNGLISFNLPIYTYTPAHLPAIGNMFIAPFWADVYNVFQSDIYYRESTEASLLSQATSDIRRYFHNMNFSAKWVFVVTWHKVPYFGSSSSKVNTFQAVITTDGNLTYVMFNYGDIEWTTGTASGGSSVSGLGGIPALAGINSGNFTGFYEIPGSMSASIINLASTSNVGFSGRWAFQVNDLIPDVLNGKTTLLYPYGYALDTVTEGLDDHAPYSVNLSTVIPIFGTNYSSLYVNYNGLISFSAPVGPQTPQNLPLSNIAFLAPFWTHVSSYVGGYIFFRLSRDAELLSRATSDISSYFNITDFSAQWVLVVTWSRTENITNKVNTFQTILSSDGNVTYLLFNYADINWTTGTAAGGASEIGMGGMSVLAGINSGKNTGYYKLPGSFSSGVISLSSTSNVNFTGCWSFKVDKLILAGPNGILDPTPNDYYRIRPCTELLKGDPGTPGLQGLQGDPGINGSIGVKGDPGQMGPQGAKGDNGGGVLSYVARNCKELLDQGVVMSGWYTIYPDGMVPLQVLCDMDTDGGGWIVFQRRYDGSVDFYLGWDSYRRGFGSRLTEFWLGNDNLSHLTSRGTWDLRVDLRDFNNTAYYAKYSAFRIAPASDNYRLTIGAFLGGNAGDSLSYNNGMAFSTKDRDNDQWSSNCATQWPGAWWFTNCFIADLNGVYRLQQNRNPIGVLWATASTSSINYSFKISEMKIRPE